MSLRPNRIGVRLNAEERKYVWEQAGASALSASEFIRRQILGKQIVSKASLVALGELSRVLGELRRLGGLLKNIHVETHGRYSTDTRDAIKALESYARDLRRVFNNFNKKGEE